MCEMKEWVQRLKKSGRDVFGSLDNVVLFVGEEQWVSIVDRDYEDETTLVWHGDTAILCGLKLVRVRLDDYLAMGIESDVGGGINE